MQEPRLELSVVRHGERWAVPIAMSQPEMAATLSNDLVADGLERARSLGARDAGQVAHAALPADGDAEVDLAGGVWDRLTALAHIVDGQRDGFTDVVDGLSLGVALAVAAGKRRDDRDVSAVGIRFEDDVVAALAHE